ncbi:MAG TPA: peptidoglycan-binding protein, partial [Thermoanaerobaculia bacterium]|nr:peptidoglycan-binding protein [Thermoanaerobaculia bacterium]
MKLQGRDLSNGTRGDDVRLLHRELRLLGFRLIPDNEIHPGIFGTHTFAAVREVQRQAGLPVTGVVDTATARVISTRTVSAPFDARTEARDTRTDPGILINPVTTEDTRFIVRGRVLSADGRPQPDLLVRAFDRDLRSETLLGESATDAAGRYDVLYTAEPVAPDEKKTADLVVRAFDGRGEDELAASPILFNAGPVETIDLILGGETYRGPSEYEQLVAELTPLLQGISLNELTEDEKFKDVSFLHSETGQELKRITFLIVAHRLHKETDLEPEVFYGLFRQGLPTRLPALLAASPAAVRRALVRSAEANIIPLEFADRADAVLERLGKLRVQTALQPGVEAPSLSDLLRLTLEDDGLREDFLAAYAGHSGSIEDFWHDLERLPDFERVAQDLKLSVQLGALTGNHLPLVDMLQRMQREGTFREISDLARFDEEGWLDLLGRISEGGLPPGVPGADEDEKARNYARALSNQVEDAFPTAYLAHRLEGANLSARQDLLTFFEANPDFNVRSTRLGQYLQDHPGALDHLENPAETRAGIKALQRVSKLTRRSEHAIALLEEGADSAHSIARMGENVFQSRFGKAVGGKARAKKIYARAQQVEARALSLALEAGVGARKTSLMAVPDETVRNVGGPAALSNLKESAQVAESAEEDGGVPEWSALFGSIELCGCSECRSVGSPAAYLVDVLHFLSGRPSKTASLSTKDVLFERRPDLGEIELTCQNTNTPLPYVDLVNEALENAVAPFSSFAPFALPAGVEADLNSRSLSAALRNAFNPALSTEAVVTVGGEGRPWDVAPDWWTIDEPAFTYTIRKEAGLLTVVARSLQTRGTAAERAANPQYVNAAAYDVLGQAVYPWSLPFDLWADEARAYLEHLGVPRFEIMERFQPGERAAILEEAVLAREHLGLTGAQADLVTGAASPEPWNLWGF